MLIFVLISNLLITVFNLYIAWKIWQLRQVLAIVTDYLHTLEKSVNGILTPAPQVIMQGKQGTGNLKITYRKLELQLQQINKILQLLSLANFVWRSRLTLVGGKPFLSREKPKFVFF